MRTLTLEQFQTELKAQGVKSHNDFAFRCPICGTIQSSRDLIAAGAGKTFDDVERYLAFSCVGCFTNAGPHKKGKPPGKGCDWTLGGLLSLHNLTVITPDGEKHPRFEIATPDEAQALAARHSPIPEPAKSVDPDQNATGGVLTPSMAAEQSGEREAGEMPTAGASAAASPALLAPADPAAVEGGCGHAPEVFLAPDEDAA